MVYLTGCNEVKSVLLDIEISHLGEKFTVKMSKN